MRFRRIVVDFTLLLTGMAPLYARTQIWLKQPNVKNVYLTPFRMLPYAKAEME